MERTNINKSRSDEEMPRVAEERLASFCQDNAWPHTAPHGFELPWLILFKAFTLLRSDLFRPIEEALCVSSSSTATVFLH